MHWLCVFGHTSCMHQAAAYTCVLVFAAFCIYALYALVMHVWVQYRYCVLSQFACKLHEFWSRAKIAHAKCVLSCSVPFVCILACRSVWMFCSFTSMQVACIGHAFSKIVAAFWANAYFMHAHANCVVVLASTCVLYYSGSLCVLFVCNAYCVLFCSVPSVCIVTCSSVWMSFPALVVMPVLDAAWGTRLTESPQKQNKAHITLHQCMRHNINAT